MRRPPLKNQRKDNRIPNHTFDVVSGYPYKPKGLDMFCAQCGSEASENQKFCRSCGTKLLVVTPPVDQDSKTPSHGKNAVARLANDIGMTGALTLAASMALGIIVLLTAGIFSITLPAVLGRVFQIGVYLAFIAITAGLFLKILGWVLPPESKVDRDKRKFQPETPRTDKLESKESLGSIPSVTDHTTKLLEERGSEE